jgi:RNA 3'-terminal phosphate cyclase (ATP)
VAAPEEGRTGGKKRKGGNVLEIDGSRHSGSGTLLRYSAALATLLSTPLHMTRIRASRGKTGLRPQHLQALLACSSLSGGEIQGAEVGSTEIYYHPGKSLGHGDFRWDIGTAGSTTMLAFTLIPPALFAKGPSRFTLTGGLFQDSAPSAFHMQHILLPILRRMGAEVHLEILRPGYPPRGEGCLQVEMNPLDGSLLPLQLPEQGRVKEIRGISLASHLEEGKVSIRMAEESRRLLNRHGYRPNIAVVDDRQAAQKGAALCLWAETGTDCLLGADRAGAPGRRSESLARFVVSSLLEDLATQATTDRYLADQLILFAALAKGTSRYLIPRMTDHIRSNLWLVEKILGVKTGLKENILTIEGMGFQRAH